MAPRRRCPTCGSKQWHKEPLSGLVACSEGHVLQNYRNETTEITEVGPHAMKKRTLKSSKMKKGRTSKADPKLYRGARGRYHYFLCLQLLLRKQIVALTHLWSLPSEFEIVCRDLWALNLALLPDPPPAEPYHHAQKFRADHDGGVGGGGDAPTATSDSQPKPKLERKDTAKQDSDDGSEDGEENGEQDREAKDSSDSDHKVKDNGESSSSEEEDEEEDAELEALMLENSDLSGSSSDEREKDDEAHSHAGRKKRRKERAGQSEYESPISTIAVLVVACWMLRIPIMYRDFTRIIERYEIPYLDGARKLPRSMVEHLTKHSIQALSPPHAPRTMAVHRVASRLAKKLNGTYGIYTPEINAASLLWRITKEMGGTPLLYRLTKRVAGVLSVPLTLHWTLSAGLERMKGTEGVRRQYDSVPPEVGLLGALIIVVKMVHGLDGTTVSEEEEDAVGCGLGSAKAYMRLIEQQIGSEDRAEFDTRQNLQVANMPDGAIDDYIGFCAEILGSNDGDGAVDRFFGRTEGGRKEEKQPQKTRGPQEPGRGGRAGREYKIWNSRDVGGTAAAEYAAVVGLGEQTVGMAVGGMLEAFERRLVRWRRR